MENCLDENEVAEYADWLLNNEAEKQDEKVMSHVEHCLQCKQEIIDDCDLLITLNKTHGNYLSHNNDFIQFFIHLVQKPKS